MNCRDSLCLIDTANEMVYPNKNCNPYIYENNNSICHELCKEIIEMYENKDTIDKNQFSIPKNNKKWCKIEEFLYKELHTNLFKYIDQINCSHYTSGLHENMKNSLFNNATLEIDKFLINHYERNTGQHSYTDDFQIDYKESKYRVITFIWYLNTIDEGGEIEFLDSYKIKSTIGKLVLFPSNWCFQYRGLMPISDSKYIITGWFYIRNDSL